MTHSAAQILRNYLIDEGVFGDVDDSALEWPVYLGHMPDSDSLPSEIAAIYDPGEQDDGRIMRTGENITHPLVQIKVRALDYAEGYAKAKEAIATLRAVLRESVTIDASNYTVQSVSPRGGVVSLGLEPVAKKRRHLFTANFLTTIRSE